MLHRENGTVYESRLCMSHWSKDKDMSHQSKDKEAMSTLSVVIFYFY